MKDVEKPYNDEEFIRENYELLMGFRPQNVVNVLDKKAQQADFVHKGWQVVVQKQCTLHKEVRNEIDRIAEE